MEPSLLQAVLADPQDDNVRLVMADFLEERGEIDRATFIRIQCRLASLGDCQRDFSRGLSCCCRFCHGGGMQLRRRERELQGLHGDTWALPLALAAGFPATPVYGATNGRDSFGNPRYHHICSEYVSDGDRRLAWKFRRGFVESIETDTKTFLAHGPALTLAAPLERVTLTDCRALESDRDPGFKRFSLVSPHKTLEMIRQIRPLGFGWHETEQDVLDALSLAALTWARGQAVRCPACGGDGVRTVDTGGNVWQSPCPDCAGTGKRGGRAADMPRPEQSAARAPSS